MARKYFSSMLWCLLTLFNMHRASFMETAVKCDMKWCLRSTEHGERGLPLVPHATNCTTQSYCVKHCSCYAEAQLKHELRKSSLGGGGVSVLRGGGGASSQAGSGAAAAYRDKR